MTVAEPVREDNEGIRCGPCVVGKHHWHDWLKHRLEPCDCDWRRVSPVVPSYGDGLTEGKDRP